MKTRPTSALRPAPVTKGRDRRGTVNQWGPAARWAEKTDGWGRWGPGSRTGLGTAPGGGSKK